MKELLPTSLRHRLSTSTVALVVGVLTTLVMLCLTTRTFAKEVKVPNIPDENSKSYQEAQRRWTEGIAATKANDFERGLALFRQVYALVPKPKVLMNIGVLEIRVGEYVKAATHLSAFLAMNAAESDEERKTMEAELRTAESKIGRLELDIADDKVLLTIDGQAIEPPFSERNLYTEPGIHHLQIIGSGIKSVDEKIELKAGESYRVSVEPKEKEPASAPVSGASRPLMPSEPTISRWPVAKRWTVIGGGVLTAASLGTAIYGVIKANNATSDADALRSDILTFHGDNRPCSSAEGQASELCTELDDLAEEREQSKRIATLGWVGTGVFGVATIATWILWPNEEVSIGKRIGTARLSPWISSAGAGWVMAGQF